MWLEALLDQLKKKNRSVAKSAAFSTRAAKLFKRLPNSDFKSPILKLLHYYQWQENSFPKVKEMAHPCLQI